MKAALTPEGFHFESLRREHPRKAFGCGQDAVDDWIRTKALQQQEKRLSTTRVLLDSTGFMAGYFTLATGQVAFDELPADITRRLPKRLLPVATLAWLGVDSRFKGQGLGCRLMAQALRDCYDAGKMFSFIAIVLDCVDESAKEFYKRFQFREIPGRPLRLFLSASELEAMMLES